MNKKDVEELAILKKLNQLDPSTLGDLEKKDLTAFLNAFHEAHMSMGREHLELKKLENELVQMGFSIKTKHADKRATHLGQIEQLMTSIGTKMPTVYDHKAFGGGTQANPKYAREVTDINYNFDLVDD